MSNDHKKRLQARLEWEGFSETKIKSDGNCQFSSLADQLFKSSDCHEKVRERIVKQLKSCPKSYKGLVEMDSSKKRRNDVPKDFSEYVKNMSKNGVWGDDVTLQAAADAFGVKIVLITSYKEPSSLEILPRSLKFQRVIYLSYLAGVHYNSIYLKEETNTASLERQGKKEKEKEMNENEDSELHGKKEEENENEKDNELHGKKEKEENEKKNKKNKKKKKDLQGDVNLLQNASNRY